MAAESTGKLWILHGKELIDLISFHFGSKSLRDLFVYCSYGNCYTISLAPMLIYRMPGWRLKMDSTSSLLGKSCPQGLFLHTFDILYVHLLL